MTLIIVFIWLKMMIRNLSLCLSGVIFLSASSLVLAFEALVEEDLVQETDPQKLEDLETQEVSAIHNLHIFTIKDEEGEKENI